LDAATAIIFHQDALSWLQAGSHGQRPEPRFDLVFLDPPFHSNLLEQSCSLLNSSGILAEDAIIYVEHNVDANIVVPENWFCLKEKKAGQVAYKLYEHRNSKVSE
jgi:16S rRNA (guanine966-N2)-methyltransferase